MQVVMLPLSDLRAYEGNARTHPGWQVAQIARSIEEFGFTNPVLVGEDGVLIAGHGRLEAAKLLGMDEVPAIVLDHLTPAQRRALVIADNKIAENAGWDEDMLAREMAALKDEAFDLDVIGFSETELDDLLSRVEDDEDEEAAERGDPDFVPEVVPEPVTQPGWRWILGDHVVLCGDATDAAAVLEACGGEPVDAVWTDPPYNVDYEGSAGKILNDKMEASDFRQFLASAFVATAKAMKPGAAIYVAHADTEGLAFRSAFTGAGLKLSGCLVWVKPSLVLGRSDYQWRHEPILYGWMPGAAHRWFGGRSETTVFEDPGLPLRLMGDGTIQLDVEGQTVVIKGEGMSIEAVEGSVIRCDKPARNGDHPTMKPVSLIERMLANSTRRGDTVLDPFGGSGSTLIACETMRRRARLVELDPKFCDVIVRRWQEFTKMEATLDGDGRTFSEIVEARRAA